MAERPNTRYLGNSNTMEVHDLWNQKPQCQIDEIIKAGHAVAITTLAGAQAAGYDNCSHCLGESTR